MSRQPVYPPQGACPPGAQQCPYPSTPQSGYSTYPSTPQYGYARAQASGYPGAGSAPFCGTNAQQGFMPKPSKGGVPKEQCSGRLDLGCPYELMCSILSADEDTKFLDDLAVENFQRYLRIRTVQPNVNYDRCIEFLQEQAESLMLPCHVYELTRGKPTLVMTWMGRDPYLPSILLNSHMDVVPVYERKWKFRPFAAKIDKGVIYGRGAQDMKSVGIQYLEAIRRLKLRGKSFRRTIHIMFSPDEEIGAEFGMKEFAESEQFDKLDVGFGLDEGAPYHGAEFLVFYGERATWELIFHCVGVSGHGSLMMRSTAGEKAAYILSKLAKHKKEEQQRAKGDLLAMSQNTSMTVSVLSGGVATNTIPEEFTIYVDCRVALDEDVNQLEETLRQWCKEAGRGVTLEIPRQEPLVSPTMVDETNPYWLAFRKALDCLDLKFYQMISPGASDARFWRMKGIPAIGFSPMNHTKILVHSDDECLEVKTFLKGIEIYCEIISNLADVPKQE